MPFCPSRKPRSGLEVPYLPSKHFLRPMGMGEGKACIARVLSTSAQGHVGTLVLQSLSRWSLWHTCHSHVWHTCHSHLHLHHCPRCLVPQYEERVIPLPGLRAPGHAKPWLCLADPVQDAGISPKGEGYGEEATGEGGDPGQRTSCGPP